MSDINNDPKMSTIDNEAQDMMAFDGSSMDSRPGEKNPPTETANDAKKPPNQTTEYEPFSRYYLGDWSSVEHLFKIVINPDVRENGSSSSQSAPLPTEFGVDNNQSAEESSEENIHDLIMAFDNVILAQPNPPSPRLEDLQYIDFEIYPFTHCNYPGGQERIFEKMQE